MVEEWLLGDFDVYPYNLHHMKHDQINIELASLKAGKSIRAVVHFQLCENMSGNILLGEMVHE